jgi:SagB-type dehydrogenase family enzyme
MIDGGYQYHWLTSYERGRMPAHRLDWSRQPSFFKEYSGAENFLLARPEDLPAFSLAELYRSRVRSAAAGLDFSGLSRLLLLGSVITARSSFAAGEILYRSHPSAGALYPVEIYLAWPGRGSLPAGLFHYDLRRPALERIGACPDSAVSGPELQPTLVLSVVPARSAWKYRERAYRYLLLDCGHLLENLRLGLKALGIGGTITADFPDSGINRALSFSPGREMALVLIRLAGEGGSPGGIPAGSRSARGLASGHIPSALGVEYPLLDEVHEATAVSLAPVGGPISNLLAGLNRSGPGPAGERVGFSGSGRKEPVCDYGEALRRRRSRRNFTPRPGRIGINDLAELFQVLESLLPELARPRPEITFAATGISGLPDGFYAYDGEACGFVRCGSEVPDATAIGRACLDQRWAGLAALKFLFWSRLAAAESAFGPRAYRRLNLAAGQAAQALYLAAETAGLGACGVGAFFDRELARAFALDEGCDPLYLVAVGPLAGAG